MQYKFAKWMFSKLKTLEIGQIINIKYLGESKIINIDDKWVYIELIKPCSKEELENRKVL